MKTVGNTGKSNLHSNVCSRKCGTIETENKSGLGGAGNTETRGLTPTKEGLVNDSTQTPEATRKDRVLEYLAMAREDLQRAERTRDYYTTLGRRYGLSWEEMGRALGTTGAAVRLRMKRAMRHG